MNESQRRSADIAYGCYLWAGACLAIGKLVDVVFGKSTSTEDFATLQGIGMLVLFPLTLVSLAAVVFGVISSWKLRAWWSSEWGLGVLPAILVLLFVVFAIEDQKPGPDQWLSYVAAAYVLLAFFFTLRWFAVRRKRQAA